MLVLALALASLAADVSWTDHSGQCPATRGQAAVGEAAEAFDTASIEVEVEATDDGLAATLRLQTPDGAPTRTLRSPACDTLVEAAVLITRAAAMAAFVPEPPPVEPEPEPQPAADPVVDPQPEPAPGFAPNASTLADPSPRAEPRKPRTRSPLFASLRGFGFGTFGITPGFGGGGGLAVGVGSEFWRADLSGMVAAPTDTDDDPGIQAWAWSVGARGCGTFDVLQGRLQPGVCGGVEVGEQLGEGTGVLDDPSPQRGPWFGATLGPTLRAFVVPGLAVVLDVDAVVSVRRPGFRVLEGAAIHTPNVLAPRVALGLELHLPRR